MINCSSGPNFLRLRQQFLSLAKNAIYTWYLCVFTVDPRKDTEFEIGLIKGRQRNTEMPTALERVLDPNAQFRKDFKLELKQKFLTGCY